jgi:tetratricopeptide (TPR) repeat protein
MSCTVSKSFLPPVSKEAFVESKVSAKRSKKHKKKRTKLETKVVVHSTKIPSFQEKSLSLEERKKVNSYMDLSKKAYAEGDSESLELNLRLALKIDPIEASALGALGSICADDNRLEEAEKYFVKLNELKMTSKSHWNIGRVRGLQKRWEESLEYSLISVQLDPNNIIARYGCGVAYHKLSMFDKAIEAFSEAIKRKPDMSGSYIYRAHSYVESLEFQKALDDYNRVEEMNPEEDTLYLFRGTLHHRMCHYSQAEYDFSKSIEKNEQRSTSIGNRGRLYDDWADNCSADRVEELLTKAIDDYEEAFLLCPGSRTSQDELSNLLRKNLEWAQLRLAKHRNQALTDPGPSVDSIELIIDEATSTLRSNPDKIMRMQSIASLVHLISDGKINQTQETKIEVILNEKKGRSRLGFRCCSGDSSKKVREKAKYALEALKQHRFKKLSSLKGKEYSVTQIERELKRITESPKQEIRQESLERLSNMSLGTISPASRNSILEALINVIKNDNYEMGLQAIVGLGQLASGHIQLMGPAQREKLVEALRWGMATNPGNKYIEMAVKISCIRVLGALGIDVDREDAKKLLLIAARYAAPKIVNVASGGIL